MEALLEEEPGAKGPLFRAEVERIREKIGATRWLQERVQIQQKALAA